MIADDRARLMPYLRAGSGPAWTYGGEVAYEESSHGTVMVFQGYGIGSIGINLAGDPMAAPRSTLHVTGGYCKPRDGCPRPLSSSVWVAGHVGATMAGYPARPLGAIPRSHDHQQARIDDPGFDPFKAADEARRILTPCWVAVCKLAEALLERGELDGWEAEKIVRDNLPTSIRDERKLWGDPPPPPRQPWQDEADRLMAHYRQFGHFNASDARDIEDITEELLAKHPSLADPKYRPGTPENVAMYEQLAVVKQEEIEELEAIFPEDRTPWQQARLDLLTLDDDAPPADLAEILGRMDRIKAEQQQAQRRLPKASYAPVKNPYRGLTDKHAAILREFNEIVKQGRPRGSVGPAL